MDENWIMYNKIILSIVLGFPAVTAAKSESVPAAMGHAHVDHEPMDHSHLDHFSTGNHEITMKGLLGDYESSMDSSGTGWQPAESNHHGIHQTLGDWNLMTHGFIDAIYDHQDGLRGGQQNFSESMLMVMGQRTVENGTLALRGMFSLDPTMGKSGYPELFQTGETADGKTSLVDRQHPHNLFMELSTSFSHSLTDHISYFFYAGLPGEPALGPSSFMHRQSSGDNPEAPITHHWLDSTHITNGVATLGFVVNKFKIESSAFYGREPDQFRYKIEPGPLDSASFRLTYNPNQNLSGQISRGHIHSPEALNPAVDIDRTTASIESVYRVSSNIVSTTLAWGKNKPMGGKVSNAFLLESTWVTQNQNSVLGRFESVDKDELFQSGNVNFGNSFKINKYSLGYIQRIVTEKNYSLGVGAVASTFFIPTSLTSYYGQHPSSLTLFVQAKI